MVDIVFTVKIASYDFFKEDIYFLKNCY